jgi:hypothetical protein
MERVRPPGFVLAAADFLGGGADAGGKADFQGCSEFNPVLIFSQPEQQEFAREENHSRRNAENAPNRRVVIFLFRPGTEVDLSKWPCPRASEGTAGCVKRLHTDAAQRQAPGPTRREYAKGEATFSCRFYDRLSQRSPCERPSEFSSLLQWVSHVPPDKDAARLHQAIPKASLGTVKGRSVGQDNLGLPYRAYSIHPLRPQPLVKLQIRGDENAAALGPDITVDLIRALVAPATGAEGARGVFGIAPPPPPESEKTGADEEPTIEPPAFDPNEPRLEVPPEDEVPGQPEPPHGR